MTNQESEYQTTVVKKRYTNLDVLCDDLDLAKVQRPVFKGICTECSHDVDLIIINKNLPNYRSNLGIIFGLNWSNNYSIHYKSKKLFLQCEDT